MPAERSHRKKTRWNYHLVLLPHEDAGKSWSFRIALWGLLLSLVVYTVAIGALTVFLLKWTPLGVWIPVKNPELERRYGKEITALQEKLSRIVSELDGIQSYNSKLRQALGSDLMAGEKSPVANGMSKTEADQAQPGVPEKDIASEIPYETDEAPNQPFTSAYPRSATTVAASTTDLFRNNLPLRLPAKGYVTRGFQPSQGHFGIDIAGKQGSPVAAAADGFVVFAGWTYDAGNMIIIAHGGGYFTFYKHNQALLKAANSLVKRGEPIALLGNTGAMSHGPHLHFEVWKDGVALDPSDYVLNFHLY
jgi:murein DD-endopeptidase MepM/ murein hydrolase activator NlpD